jgi:hypothetical protein
MAPKIIACLLTLAANVVAGLGVFFVMLITMNGYSEDDAMFGIVTYVVLAVLVTILMSVSAALLPDKLQKRKFSGVAAALIAVLVFSVSGAVLKVICGLIGVSIAEFMRVNY